MKHRCHWPGCKREVPPRLWGCSEHWAALPTELRAKIWGAYVEGQEITKTPSPEYLRVAAEVDHWIRSTFSGLPDKHDPGRWARLVRFVRTRDEARRARAQAKETTEP